LIVDLVHEIFIKKVYNPPFMRIKNGDTVVDIGANAGVFCLFALKFGAKRIIAIEPLKKNIALVKRNFGLNKSVVPIIIEAAVSFRNGSDKLYLNDLDSQGSLSAGKGGRELKKYIIVRSLTLARVLSDYKIKRVDFLKIDCEGGEGAIIKSMNKKGWKKINRIALEYHDDMSVLSHQQIVKVLRKSNYKTKMSKTGTRIGYIYAWRA